MAKARALRCPLIVAKADRLARSQLFLMRLVESGVDVRFCDLPQLEGATGKFMLQQMAAVAELEAGLISERTKAALAAAKARGVRLGGDRGGRAPAWSRKAANKARLARANQHAADIEPMIEEVLREGVPTLSGIAAWLNKAGVPTARGGKWQAVQVQRVLERGSIPIPRKRMLSRTA